MDKVDNFIGFPCMQINENDKIITILLVIQFKLNHIIIFSKIN